MQITLFLDYQFKTINFTDSLSVKSNNNAKGRCGQNIDYERATPFSYQLYSTTFGVFRAVIKL